MFTMILLVYLQMGRTVSLAGAVPAGQFATLALCRQAAASKKGALPIPRGYAAAWQDSLCVPIDRDVRVGNERLTAFEQLLADSIEPRACDSEGVCRRIGIEPAAPQR